MSFSFEFETFNIPNTTTTPPFGVVNTYRSMFGQIIKNTKSYDISLGKITTRSLGGATGAQLITGITNTKLRIREWVTSSDTSSVAFEGAIIATSTDGSFNQTTWSPSTQDFPESEYIFETAPILQSGTEYVIEALFAPPANISLYTKTSNPSGPYPDGISINARSDPNTGAHADMHLRIHSLPIYKPNNSTDFENALKYYFGETTTLPGGANASADTVGNYTNLKTKIASWDTSLVTNMSNAFSATGRTHFNVDISKWDVTSVTDFTGMFDGCNFGHDITIWDVSASATLTNMFRGSYILEQTRYNSMVNAWYSNGPYNEYLRFHNGTPTHNFFNKSATLFRFIRLKCRSPFGPSLLLNNGVKTITQSDIDKWHTDIHNNSNEWMDSNYIEFDCQQFKIQSDINWYHYMKLEILDTGITVDGDYNTVNIVRVPAPPNPYSAGAAWSPHFYYGMTSLFSSATSHFVFFDGMIQCGDIYRNKVGKGGTIQNIRLVMTGQGGTTPHLGGGSGTIQLTYNGGALICENANYKSSSTLNIKDCLIYSKFTNSLSSPGAYIIGTGTILPLYPSNWVTGARGLGINGGMIGKYLNYEAEDDGEVNIESCQVYNGQMSLGTAAMIGAFSNYQSDGQINVSKSISYTAGLYTPSFSGMFGPGVNYNCNSSLGATTKIIVNSCYTVMGGMLSGNSFSGGGIFSSVNNALSTGGPNLNTPIEVNNCYCVRGKSDGTFVYMNLFDGYGNGTVHRTNLYAADSGYTPPDITNINNGGIDNLSSADFAQDNTGGTLRFPLLKTFISGTYDRNYNEYNKIIYFSLGPDYTPDNNTDFLAALDYYFDQSTNFISSTTNNASASTIGKHSDSTSKYRIGFWNTINVTDMSNIFNDSARQTFNQDIGLWNTDNVSDLTNIFRNCSSFNQNISTKYDSFYNRLAWDISNVTSLRGAFYGNKNFNKYLNWNTDNVTDMEQTFFQANSFGQDISSVNIQIALGSTGTTYDYKKWNTENVTTFGETFRDCSSSAFVTPGVGTWNTHNVNNMSGMFLNATHFNEDISEWNTENVTNASYLLANTSFNQYIRNWDISYTTPNTDVTYMFQNTPLLSNPDYNELYATWYNLSNGSPDPNVFFNFYHNGEFDNFMFRKAFLYYFGDSNNYEISGHSPADIGRYSNPATRPHISSWITKNVTDMSYAFSPHFSTDSTAILHRVLFNEDISTWNTNSAENISFMFLDCSGFNQNISTKVVSGDPSYVAWDISNVTQMQNVLKNCSQFDNNGEHLSWNMVNVDASYGYGLFEGCSVFNRDISETNIELIADISRIEYIDNTTAPAGTLSSSTLNYLSNPADTLSIPIETGTIPSNPVRYLSKIMLYFNIGAGGGTHSIVISGQTGTLATASATKNPGAQEYILTPPVKLESNKSYSINISDVVDLAIFEVTGANAWNLNQLYKNPGVLSVVLKFKAEVVDENRYNYTQWDISGLSSLNNMFKNASIFNQDLSTWRTENVKTTREMFSGASNFNKDIRFWKTNNLIDISGMFSGASNFDKNISTKVIVGGELAWDLSNVTTMTRAMKDCGQYDNSGEPLLWNTSKVTKMEGLFENCSQFNRNIETRNVTIGGTITFKVWDVSGVVSLNNMFKNAKLFDQDLNTWEVSGNTTSMRNIFYGANNFNQDLYNWNTVNIVDMSGAFSGDGSMNIFNKNIRNWDVSTSTITTNMFNNTVLSNYDYGYRNIVNGWNDIVNGTPNNSVFFIQQYIPDDNNDFKAALAYYFDESSNFITSATNMASHNNIGRYNSDNSFVIQDWNTVNVTDMSGSFTGSRDSFNNYIGYWNTQNVVNMSNMFSSNVDHSFNRDISLWNTDLLENASGMFKNAKSFNQDLYMNIYLVFGIPNWEAWNTNNIKNISSMFDGADRFNGNISTWRTDNLENINKTFNGAINFNQNISTKPIYKNNSVAYVSWNTENVENMTETFKNATTFNQFLNWNIDSVDGSKCYGLFNGASSYNNDLSTNDCKILKTTTASAIDISNDEYLHLPAQLTFMNTGTAAKYVDFSFNTSFSPNKYLTAVDLFFDTTATGTCEISILNSTGYELVKTVVDMNDITSVEKPKRVNFNPHVELDENKTYRLSINPFKYVMFWNWGSSLPPNTRYLIVPSPLIGYSCELRFSSYLADGSHNHFTRWDMKNIKDVNSMFKNANNFNQCLTTWDMSNVRFINSIFEGASNFNNGELTNTINKPLHWKLPLLTESLDISRGIQSAFSGCNNFNQEIGTKDWNVSEITNFQEVFKDCNKLSDKAVFGISGWDVSNGKDFSKMFSGCSDSSFITPGVKTWNTNNMINIASMFKNDSSFNEDVSDWNTSKIFTTEDCFSGCSDFSQNIRNWDISFTTFTNVEKMFNNTDKLLDATHYRDICGGWIDITNGTPRPKYFFNHDGIFDTLQFYEALAYYFGENTQFQLEGYWPGDTAKFTLVGRYADNDTSDNISFWRTDRVTDMSFSISPYDNINSLSKNPNRRVFDKDISGWNTEKVENMAGMFFDSHKFNRYLGNWNTGKVENMAYMFGGHDGNTEIGPESGLSNWNTENVKSMSCMFKNASNFNVDISNWNTSSLEDTSEMFSNCFSFNKNLSTNEEIFLDLSASRYTNYPGDVNHTNPVWQVFTSSYTGKLEKIDLRFTHNGNASLNSTQDISLVLYDGSGLPFFPPGAPGSTPSDLSYINIPNTHKYATTFTRPIIVAGDENIAVTIPITGVELIAGNQYTFEVKNGLAIGAYQPGGFTDLISFVDYNIGHGYRTLLYDIYTRLPDSWITNNLTKANGMFFNANSFNNGEIGNTMSKPLKWKINNLTDTSEMFSGCSNFNQNIGAKDWIVTNCVNFKAMFNNCSILTDNAVVGISGWDTRNVENMSYMFTNCYDISFSTPGVKTWKTNKVTSGDGISRMFKNAPYFIEDIGTKVIDNSYVAWNTSNIKNMEEVFYNDISGFFNGDISGWSIDNALDMSGMFSGCGSFNRNINTKVMNNSIDGTYIAWDISKVKTMQSLFKGAKDFNQDISKWNTINVENMREMFSGCSNFNQDISTKKVQVNPIYVAWDVSNVEDFSSMFEGATNFNQEIGSWNTKSAKNINKMFKNAQSFNKNISRRIHNISNTPPQPDISYIAWDVSKVTDMQYTFEGALKYNNDGGPFEWEIVSISGDKMVGLFKNANDFDIDIYSHTSHHEPNVRFWDVSNVTHFNSLFEGSTKFNQDLSGWNTKSAISFTAMFKDASTFRQNIDYWFDSSNVLHLQDISGMFSGAERFIAGARNWIIPSTVTLSNLFDGADDMSKIYYFRRSETGYNKTPAITFFNYDTKNRNDISFNIKWPDFYDGGLAFELIPANQPITSFNQIRLPYNTDFNLITPIQVKNAAIPVVGPSNPPIENPSSLQVLPLSNLTNEKITFSYQNIKDNERLTFDLSINYYDDARAGGDGTSIPLFTLGYVRVNLEYGLIPFDPIPQVINRPMRCSNKNIICRAWLTNSDKLGNFFSGNTNQPNIMAVNAYRYSHLVRNSSTRNSGRTRYLSDTSYNYNLNFFNRYEGAAGGSGKRLRNKF